MKITLSLIAFIITLQHSTGQDLTDKLILTKEENDKWITELEAAPLSKQLISISTRILLDTNIYVKRSYPDRIRIQDENNKSKKVESFGRPLFFVDGQCKHYSLNITNHTSSKSISELSELLTEKNIEKITIYKGVNATAIYGTRATAGIIILTVKDKKVCEQIQSIDFGRI